MNSFEYTAPADIGSALRLLGDTWGPAEILAGGTDLLALMKDDVVTPERIVNIKNIAELNVLTVDSSGLTAGALVTLDELARDVRIQKTYPALAAAISDAASPQIRNRATLGGNLCQRPRCWYFRNGFGLLATDTAGKSLVTRGDNRYHAILGNDGPAFFVSPSTIAPVLVALGAQVSIQGVAGSRTLALQDFYRAPASNGEREHDLGPNEIVMKVTVPAPVGPMAYYEVRQKHAFDWPLATATVMLKMNNNIVASASVVLGHVAPFPWRSVDVEKALAGHAIDANLAEQASQAGLKSARNLGRNGYKIQIARVCLKRAILQAAGFQVPPPHPSGGN